MALVRGSIDKLLGKSLVKQYHKYYALGFRISRQMIEDDLYGGILKKARKLKLKIQTIHRIDLGHCEVELDQGIIRITGTNFTIEQVKDVVKAINMLLKIAKTPAKKKVVRRKRRVKK
jgi:hypothetical protein